MLFLSVGIAAGLGCKSATESPVQDVKSPRVESKTESPAAEPVEGPANSTPAQALESNPVIATVPFPEPDFITVQHILIGFKGSVGQKLIARTKEEAESLANEVLAMAQADDADFDALVKKYTDDSHPGIYKMANNNVSENAMPGDVRPRSKMVAAFGDVGFPLQAGQVGIANYDTKKSPFGWHIIKRIK